MARPTKYQAADELQPLIDDYFDKTPMDDWTMTGLALALDMTRKQLIEYAAKSEFRNVEKAKVRVEHSYELDLKRKGQTGSIFALKNMGWEDKQTIMDTDVEDWTDEERATLKEIAAEMAIRNTSKLSIAK